MAASSSPQRAGEPSAVHRHPTRLQEGNFMPVQLTYPGVYIQEVPSGVSLISGVATSVALFIGMSQNGPLNTPTEVLSFSDYDAAFGSDISAGEMPDQARQFFQNGGSTAWIMRIADGTAVPTTVTLENEAKTATLALSAKNAGAIGDTLRIIIDYDTPTPEATFNLTTYRLTTASDGSLTSVASETHKDLSMNPAGPRYVGDVLRDNSALLALAATQPAAVAAFNGYALGAIPGASQAALETAINGAVAGLTGTFAISVDGSPATPVTLTGAGLTFANITTAVNTALAKFSRSIKPIDVLALGAGQDVIRFTSAAPGGIVRISRGVGATDITAKLGWTADDGALEVGGYAAARPAPNGVVAFLGDLTGAAAPAHLVAVLNDTKAAAGHALIMTDSPTTGYPGSGAVVPPGAGTMWQDPAGANASLAFFKANLAAIAANIQAYFNAQTPVRYAASVVGYRLVVKPTTTDTDAGANALLAGDGGGSTIADLLAGHSNVLAYRAAGGPNPSSFVSASSLGNNGGIPQLGNYTDAFATAASGIDIFNIVMLPRAAGQTDNDRANLWGPASTFAKGRRAFLIVDPPAGWKTPMAAVAGMPGARTGMLKDYAAIYWPRVQIPDPVTGILRFIDPAGTVAGCYARTDGARGVWKAPAGLDNATAGVRALERRVSDAENGLLNPLALNVLRAFTDGVVVWGARTMDGYDNSGDTDYRYVPVRRTALYIEESLYRGLKWAVFEPNDERLWARIRLSAGNFMNTMFRQGAFQGLTKDTAYFVRCDNTTTTQSDIDLGVVNVVVGFAPLRPAEFVVVTVTQMAGPIQT
jgi:phage tail sheath protein FI